MKRVVITGAVHQKIKIAQVARDLGVSRCWTSREAHHPATQKLVAAMETAIRSRGGVFATRVMADLGSDEYP